MSKLRAFLQQPLPGKFYALQTLGCRIKAALYYKYIFGSFGEGTLLRKPMLLGNPRFIHLGRRVSIRDGVRLEAVISATGRRQPLLRIGDDVLIEQNVHIVCHAQIIIGSNVAIAGHCAIVDVTHPIANRDPSVNIGSRILDEDSYIEIGDGAFIGFGAVILPGVRIGECAVIGANSVVTRDVPAYSVVAGAPAVILRTDAPRQAGGIGLQSG